jgi:hypothetical protein
VRPSIRFMGVAACTEARKRRVNLARQLLCRRDAVVAPSPSRASPPSGTSAAGQSLLAPTAGEVTQIDRGFQRDVIAMFAR